MTNLGNLMALKQSLGSQDFQNQPQVIFAITNKK